MKNASAVKNVSKQHVFAHFTSTHNHAEETKSVHHSHTCLKFHVFASVFQREWSGPHKNSSPSQRWQSQRCGHQENGDTLGLRQSTTKRWLQRLRSEGEMVSHSIGRPRGQEAGLSRVFLAFLVSHLSNCARCGSHDKIRSVMFAKVLINAWVATVPSCSDAMFANVCRRLSSSAAAAVSRGS